MPLFPTHDSDPPASDYFTSPWTNTETGQKWTSELVGEKTYRWTQYEEPVTPAITEIAWDDVTGKPAAVTALSGANTGDQDLSGLATTSALSSGLAGKAPASGISPSAITGTAVVTDDSRLSDARTPTAHTHAASDITGTAVTLSGNQTLTGTKTFSSLATNGTVVFGAGTTFFADTAAANSARSALGVARGIETVGSSQAAVVGGRYITTAAVTITDPTTRIDGSALQDGDSYEVWIGGPGNATIDGVAYVPSRFSIRRARISGAWTTPAATVTGAFNATSVSGNGSALTNLSWAAIGGTGTAASPTLGTATFAGGGSITGASGAVTIAASGTNQNIVLTPSGTGSVTSTRPITTTSFFSAGNGVGSVFTRQITDGIVASGIGLATAGQVEINNGTVGAYRDLLIRNLTASGTLTVSGATTLTGGYLLGELTVGTLPTASSNTRRRYEVTDSLSPALGATVAAGGSARCTVRSNGTAWIVIQLL